MKLDIETRYIENTEICNTKFLGAVGGCCAIPDPNPNAGYYIGAIMFVIMMLRILGYVY